jgi:hypothetical protein
MTLNSDELHQLWRISKSFNQVAIEAFCEGTPVGTDNESMSDDELKAYKELRKALHDGRFFGIGFPEPKRIGDQPVVIPKEAWAPDPTGFQLEIGPGVLGRWPYEDSDFCEVRIAPTAEHLTRTGGRSSLGNLLIKAIEELVSEGKIDVSRAQKDHFQMIRERAILLFPRNKAEIGKSHDRTVAKYFSPIFNGLKEGSE